MRLNLQTDYALRLLSHLAANQGRLVTIAAIADRFHISKHHLTKVANVLARRGIIETTRGRSGGVRLVRPLKAIRIGDVVRCMENDFELVECMSAEGGACVITSACRLNGILAEAVGAFLAVLDRYTLHDLIKRNKSLEALLAQEAA